jgi:hypothetical protein
MWGVEFQDWKIATFSENPYRLLVALSGCPFRQDGMQSFVDHATACLLN